MNTRNGSSSRRPRRGPAALATSAAASCLLTAALVTGCSSDQSPASAQTVLTTGPTVPTTTLATESGTASPGSTATGTEGSGSPSATGSATGSASPGAAGKNLTAVAAPYKLPNGVTGATAVADNGKVLALGGQDSGGKATDQVTSIDPIAKTATSAGTLHTPVANAASSVVNGTATVYGGNTKGSDDASGVTDTVQTYSGGTSQDVGKLPAPRENLNATTANGKTYLVGGDDGKSTQGDIWSTEDGKTFQTAGKLDKPVRNPAVATTGTGSDQKVTIFGGEASDGPTDAIQQFDPATGKTQTVGKLPAALKDASAFTVGGTTYLAGGQSGGQAQPKIYKFDPATNSVSDAGDLPEGVENAASAATGNNAYLLGGEVSKKVSDGVTELTPQ
ncbi:galactose oxidase [Frankia sp. AgB1.9]|uniref:Kelch repeat-containing protein n=1 Tax=unclassified Frankia TaxID=2632575 RepID=UPI0019349A00|nr:MULTISPECIES: galactose oxidase [unclassified Frankia]MBL7491268.1 galactose oxidase [Frankia sp. AgW1.1]MBL7548263.1 galactose oxidase [Frankia sp. AgB1.9]MBL7618890.1 galactose oxidase [Frankia sp. AgB1.8]